jgi:hypothetical protein
MAENLIRQGRRGRRIFKSSNQRKLGQAHEVVNSSSTYFCAPDSESWIGRPERFLRFVQTCGIAPGDGCHRVLPHTFQLNMHTHSLISFLAACSYP